MVKRVCPQCRGVFVLMRRNQRYCTDSCQQRAAWLRWNARYGRDKERTRYRRDRPKRLLKSKRVKLRSKLVTVPDDVRDIREALYEFRGWQKRNPRYETETEVVNLKKEA